MEQGQTSGKPLSGMTVLVVGCGSIGRRHIRNLAGMKIGRILACDVDEKKRNDVQREFSIDVFPDIGDALSQESCDAAFICTPPSLHLSQARELLNRDVHCFIEKPLSDGTAGIDELIGLADRKRRTVLIGYNLRFSAYFRKIREMVDAGRIGKVLSLRASVGYYLPHWRPHEDYRAGYGSKRHLGGGILLDASHELDYVMDLLGPVEGVFGLCRKVSALEIDTEDLAEITMRFKGGACAQIHLDYLQSNYRRSCEIIGDAGMLLWDINERRISVSSLADKEYHVYYEGLGANTNDMYLEELRHFFACIAGTEQSLIDLRGGQRVQDIIAKIRESSDSGRYLQI